MEDLDAGQRAPVTNGRRRPIERSCILCHRRKVKCNKQMPCSTCTRSGILCCYPPTAGEKHEPRKSRATISAIVDRLGQLERTIVAISSSEDQPTSTNNGTSPSAGGSPAHDCEAAAVSREGKGMLLHDGGSAPYVNDFLLSRVLEEEQEVRSTLTALSIDSPSPQSQSQPQPSLPLGLFGMTSQLQLPFFPNPNDLYPEKWQALKLWQAYLQNVEPQNKLLHIPTAQVTIYEAIHDSEQASAEVRCLLFSIYLAATATLSPSEVHRLLARDKITAIDGFRLGVELSISAANVFEHPSIIVVQALAIYLQVTRALNPGRSVWILLGMVIRTAQAIGLHRDPSNFSVSPFEAEMRRRLWWHIVSLDSRTGEDHGLTASFTDLPSDTKLPLAVDDNALHPAMTELPPAPQNVWTEMTSLVLIYMTAQTTQKLNRLLSTPSVIPSEPDRRATVAQLEADIEARIACCNPVIPAQRLTISVPRMILRRIEFASRQQRLLSLAKKSSQTGPLSPLADAADTADDETLAEACTIIEMGAELLGDDLLHNFRWWVEMHPQSTALLYVLWYLCVRPATPSATRAWAAVEAAFSMEACRLQRQEVMVAAGCYSSKWRVLGVLREKAMRLRETGHEVNEQMGVGDDGSEVEKVLTGMDGTFVEDAMCGDVGNIHWTSWMEDFNTRD